MTIPRWKFQILLLASLLLSGCGQNSKDKTGDLPVIDIVGNLGSYEAVPVSQYVTELEYIPLETNDDCLVAEENLEVLATSTHIFVRGLKYCYAFDRNGRFLGQIGRLGQGPGEFSYLTGLFIDKKNQFLYLETFRTLLEYSWDGVFRRSIELPKNMHESSSRNNFFVHDNLFIGHFRNHRGDLLHNFVLFDQSSKVTKLFDNYVQFKPTREMTAGENWSMKPYRIGDRIYAKEIANDTLFYLNEQNELVPHFLFDLGDYTITKERRERKSPSNRYNENGQINVPTTKPMTGTLNYLFFSFNAYNLSGKYSFPKERYTWLIDMRTLAGIYNATNQTTQLLDTDPDTKIRGLINDLDGGLSFWPQCYNADNEFIDLWRAEDMKEFLTEDYFAAHDIKDPAAHQKLKGLLQKLKEDDNPVIVIGKLKPEVISPNN